MLYAVSYQSGEEDAAKMTHMHFGHAQYLPIALPLFALLAGALALLLITGSPEAVTRLRFLQNVACGFPAPRSSAVDSQLHRECL